MLLQNNPEYYEKKNLILSSLQEKTITNLETLLSKHQ